MNQQKLSHLIAILFFSFVTMNLRADTFWNYHDIKQFPVQPSILESVDQAWIKPVEMTSWGGGKSYVRYHRNLSSIFTLNGPASNIKSRHIYVLNRDFPFRKSDTSLGMDITLFVDFMNHNLSHFQSYFSNFVGADILGSYKFKKHISTRIGDIIGTVAPTGGILGVLRGLDETDNICYPIGIGWVAGFRVGIEYYPLQWLGVFFEGTLKYNRVEKWLSPPIPPDGMNNYGVAYYTGGSYAFCTDMMTIGFKTTF